VAHGLLNQKAFSQAQPFSGQKGDHSRHCHDPQATHLKESEDHQFTKEAEPASRIHHRQASDADSRCRCKESINEPQRLAVLNSERETEKHGAQEDSNGKSQGKDLGGIERRRLPSICH